VTEALETLGEREENASLVDSPHRLKAALIDTVDQHHNRRPQRHDQYLRNRDPWSICRAPWTPSPAGS